MERLAQSVRHILLWNPSEDILPAIKHIEVKEGWVKLSRDKNYKIIKRYGDSVNEPQIVETLKSKEEDYQINLIINNLNENIEKSKQCDENKFVPLDRLKYENSFKISIDYVFEHIRKK